MDASALCSSRNDGFSYDMRTQFTPRRHPMTGRTLPPCHVSTNFSFSNPRRPPGSQQRNRFAVRVERLNRLPHRLETRNFNTPDSPN